MKYIIAMAALAASFTAQAADDFYKVSANQVFSTRNAYKVDRYHTDKTYVRVTYVTGGESSYQDVDGTLFDRILANQPELTRVTGDVYVNPLYIGNSTCNNGKSTVWVGNSVMTLTADDGCSLVTAISAKAK